MGIYELESLFSVIINSASLFKPWSLTGARAICQVLKDWITFCV